MNSCQTQAVQPRELQLLWTDVAQKPALHLERVQRVPVPGASPMRLLNQELRLLSPATPEPVAAHLDDACHAHHGADDADDALHRRASWRGIHLYLVERRLVQPVTSSRPFQMKSFLIQSQNQHLLVPLLNQTRRFQNKLAATEPGQRRLLPAPFYVFSAYRASIYACQACNILCRLRAIRIG